METHCLFLSMFRNNYSKMSSSLEEEEVKPFPMKLKPYLKDEAMISKWKYLSQVK